jgi:hypothetical protein
MVARCLLIPCAGWPAIVNLSTFGVRFGGEDSLNLQRKGADLVPEMLGIVALSALTRQQLIKQFANNFPLFFR